MATILFQGDSITDVHRGDSPNAGVSAGNFGVGYAALIRARALKDYPAKSFNFINRGISGHRIVDLYARWRVDSINLKPDVLSLLIGVNDVWHEESCNGVDLERYERFYRELLTWSIKEQPNLRLVIMEPYICMATELGAKLRPQVEQYAVVARKLAKEFGAVWIPLQQLFDEASKIAPAAHWAADSVHPTAAGHQLIADAWLAAMPLDTLD